MLCAGCAPAPGPQQFPQQFPSYGFHPPSPHSWQTQVSHKADFTQSFYYDPSAPPPHGLSERVIESAKRAIQLVEVVYYYRGIPIAGGHGTGFFIGQNEMITNFHVIGKLLIDPSITLSLNIHQYDLQKKPVERIKSRKARLKKVSALYDLALLETDESVRNYLPIGSDPTDLQNLFTVGFPGNSFAVMELKNPRLGGQYTLMTDTKRNYDGEVFKGLSGGPVVNGKGDVVGINFAGRERSGKDWLSVNLQAVRKFIEGRSDSLRCGKDWTSCFYSELSFFCKNFQIGSDFKIDFAHKSYCRGGRIKEPLPKCAAVFNRLDKALDEYKRAVAKAKKAVSDYEKAAKEADGADYSGTFRARTAADYRQARDEAFKAVSNYEKAYSSYLRSMGNWYDSDCKFTY